MKRLNRRTLTAFALIAFGIVGVFVYRELSRKADVWMIQAELEEDTTEYILEINSVEDYLNFSRSVGQGNTYKGKYVNLNADLDFTGVEDEAVMIGCRNGKYHPFAGIFDGNGHRISNIHSENPEVGGLFSCLQGVVCNLMLSDSYFSGAMVGAAAGTSLPGGYVLNCYLDAELEGTVYNNVVGNNKAEVHIYSGLDHVREPDYLNQRMIGLDDSYGVKRWLLWEHDGEETVLSQNEAVHVTNLSAQTVLGGKTVELKAYFSWPTYTWTFAIPAGYENASLDITLELSDGTKLTQTAIANAGPISIPVDSRECPIQFQFSGSAPTMMLKTQKEDAVAYLHASKENVLMGSYTILDADGSIEAEGMLSELYGHGNDSWWENKKSYNLELMEEADLLNIGTSQKYALLCGFRNNSLPTYKIVNDMAKEIGLGYAPQSEFVHLYIDGNYMGMYLLCGKMEVGENRFDIQNLAYQNELVNSRKPRLYPMDEWKSEESPAYRSWYELPHDPADITGGYVLELDVEDYDPIKSRFITDRGTYVTLKNLPYASKNEVDYIADFWQDFEDAVYSDTGYNEKGKHYTDYIDLESFADQWLFYELDMESCVVKSVYYYKESDLYGDGKIHAAQPWDLETHLIYAKEAEQDWMNRFFEDTTLARQYYKHKDFADMVKKEWKEKFAPVLEKALFSEMPDARNGMGTLDWYASNYEADYQLESSRWYMQKPLEQIEQIRTIYEKRLSYLNERFK